MKPILPSLILAVLCPVATVLAQNESVVPEACTDLPGNAALSMPLRWSQGTLQLRIAAALLPSNFIGKTVTGLRLRRPSFLGEPPYPAMQRTLTVRAGFDSLPAGFITSDLVANRPSNTAVVFGPTSVSVGATPAPGGATQVGEDLLSLQFTTPLLVIAGTLFLEFEAGDAPFVVGSDNWVDAVWFDGGVETGYAVTVGDGSCTTGSVATALVWNDPATGPVVGGTATFRMTGAPPHATNAPGTMTFLWFGLDPQPRAASPGFVGYGGSLGAIDPALSTCFQWAPLDGVLVGSVDPSGGYTQSFQLVAAATTVGMRIGVQSAWVDTSRPGLPISVSNGVMMVLDEIGVGNDCVTLYFPGSATTAPWSSFHGQMPILVFEHN
ncbi:MAG: hypothetical protein KDC98_03585 [Planctomycetes bacterium]|nr:hypothetical protein [Planctomycetota bacterium]